MDRLDGLRAANLNATLLPTGEVLVTGGSSAPGLQRRDPGGPRRRRCGIRPPGLWTTLASNAVSRTYHSTTLLLPDGRVLHTGSGEGADMPEERNAEMFSPPYLAQGPRPTIADAPGLVGYGTTFDASQTPDAADIAKISLIRLGSVTHSFDMNQRLLWLPFVAQSPDCSPSRLRSAGPARRRATTCCSWSTRTACRRWRRS